MYIYNSGFVYFCSQSNIWIWRRLCGTVFRLLFLQDQNCYFVDYAAYIYIVALFKQKMLQKQQINLNPCVLFVFQKDKESIIIEFNSSRLNRHLLLADILENKQNGRIYRINDRYWKKEHKNVKEKWTEWMKVWIWKHIYY